MSVVRTGLDRFAEPASDLGGLPSGTRVGVLAHAASVDRFATPALELLTQRTPLRVERLFAPEHGLGGEAQDMEAVGDGADRETGLPVISLYGDDASSLRPTPADLDGLEAIVCDLQDVGSRYYTFVYTLSYVMEAAGRAGLPVVVLDRPNPIGGVGVEGPLLDPALASFVGRFPLPVRHGMTIAELARFFRGACGIECDLRTIPMSGWRREMHFEDTGLPWVPPSPNMPCVDTARVYPGGCLIEGTNLSEARGTTRPFEFVGAPWLDSASVVRALRRTYPHAALFRACSFVPAFHKHAGLACQGLQLIVTDRERFRAFEVYLTMLREIRSRHPEQFDWRREPYEFETARLAIDLLLGRAEIRSSLESGESVEVIAESWAGDLSRFRETRRPFLLYPEPGA